MSGLLKRLSRSPPPQPPTPLPDFEHCAGDKAGDNVGHHCVTVDITRAGHVYHQCIFCGAEQAASENAPKPKRTATARKSDRVCPKADPENCLTVEVNRGGQVFHQCIFCHQQTA